MSFYSCNVPVSMLIVLILKVFEKARFFLCRRKVVDTFLDLNPFSSILLTLPHYCCTCEHKQSIPFFRDDGKKRSISEWVASEGGRPFLVFSIIFTLLLSKGWHFWPNFAWRLRERERCHTGKDVPSMPSSAWCGASGSASCQETYVESLPPSAIECSVLTEISLQNRYV